MTSKSIAIPLSGFGRFGSQLTKDPLSVSLQYLLERLLDKDPFHINPTKNQRRAFEGKIPKSIKNQSVTLNVKEECKGFQTQHTTIRIEWAVGSQRNIEEACNDDRVVIY
ncbi:hypothetical protein SLA2020_201790 [Shorea laevis]